MKNKHAIISLFLASIFIAAWQSSYGDNLNDCGANVTNSQINQHGDNKDKWTLVFHVKGGNGQAGLSVGSFTYSVLYIDYNNIPQANFIRNNPGWSLSNGSDFYITEEIDLTAESIQQVNVTDIQSSGCS